MKPLDLIAMGFGNLWHSRLRTILTILGVVVGIGALSSMLSFGIGMQKNITDEFRQSGLFTSFRVSPEPPAMEHMSRDKTGMRKFLPDDSKPRLNDSTIAWIAGIQGVSDVYPDVVFPGKIRYRGNEQSLNIQGLPASIGSQKPYNELMAGSFFLEDTGRVILLSWETLRDLGILAYNQQAPYEPNHQDSLRRRTLVHSDKLLGDTLELTTAVASISRLPDNPMELLGMFHKQPFTEHKSKWVLRGIFERQETRSFRALSGGAILPIQEAGKVPRVGISSVWDFFSDQDDAGSYSAVYVRLKEMKDVTPVRKMIEARGFHVFSIMDQLKEIKRAFLIMDSILGAIGIVALFIAGLGIINTMLMSILERTREIGIMKAVGASKAQVRMTFLTEAGFIGLIGGIFGLGLGWVFTQIANKVVNTRLLPAGELPADLFHFPPWLILGSILFAIMISLLAGLYPTSRAARMKPVEALRYE